MTTYTGTADYRHDQDDCTGILLVNLGTTEAPTAAAVRRYLAEFLWDPRVIEIPRPLWWLILHGVILRFRPAKVAHAYQTIWTERGSPLLANSDSSCGNPADSLSATSSITALRSNWLCVMVSLRLKKP